MTNNTQQTCFSILIITYNRVIDTLALLKNLSKQEDVNKYVGEILLLNNNSSDDYSDIKSFIKSSNLPIKYIGHNENLGVARGRNFLIQKAIFPVLLVLDDDVEFTESNAIKQLHNIWFDKKYRSNNTAIIALDIYYFDNKERQLNAFPHKNYEAYKDKSSFQTYYFTGAAHLMDRTFFEKTGLYPEDFFYGAEEYDLSYRVLEAGYTIAFDNGVKVLHKESPLGRMPNKEKLRMLWLNKSKVAWRYLPKKYFYSTVLMWSLFYLKNSGFEFSSWYKNLKNTLAIKKTIKRNPVGVKTLNYLKSVQARLSY